MKKISKTSATEFFFVLCALGIFGCAAHKTETENVKEQATATKTTDKKWDYDKIRQVREDEAATNPVNVPQPPEAKLKDQCDVMGEAAMKLAKRTGCKKLDPRLGFGENNYCCPREIK